MTNLKLLLLCNSFCEEASIEDLTYREVESRWRRRWEEGVNPCNVFPAETKWKEIEEAITYVRKNAPRYKLT